MSKNNKGLHIVFTGAPGCGKGTQARILKEKIDICHLSTGEMLREEAKKDTPLGRDLKAALDRGEFATDEMIIQMVSSRIDEDDCKNGFILDGFPRTLPQAEVLENLLKEKGITLDRVIEIQVPDEIIMERILGRYSCMKCGQGYHDKFQKPKVYGVCDACGGELQIRKDDAPETVLDRLNVYHEQTEPLKDYYANCGKLRSVEGTAPIKEITASILKVLED